MKKAEGLSEMNRRCLKRDPSHLEKLMKAISDAGLLKLFHSKSEVFAAYLFLEKKNEKRVSECACMSE